MDRRKLKRMYFWICGRNVFLNSFCQCTPSMHTSTPLWPSASHQCSREVIFCLSKLHSVGKFKLDIPLHFALQVSICTSSDFNHQGGALTFTSNPPFFLSTQNPPYQSVTCSKRGIAIYDDTLKLKSAYGVYVGTYSCRFFWYSFLFFFVEKVM